MQQEAKRRRRRTGAEDPAQLDSAVTFYTSVPEPIGDRIKAKVAAERRSASAIIRDVLVEKFGETAAA